MTITDTRFETDIQTPRARRRSLVDLFAPLEQIAAHSPNLVANHDAHFETDGETYELPRYLFVGPKGGDTPIRVGFLRGFTGMNRRARMQLFNSSNCLRPSRNWPAVTICRFIRSAIQRAWRMARAIRGGAGI